MKWFLTRTVEMAMRNQPIFLSAYTQIDMIFQLCFNTMACCLTSILLNAHDNFSLLLDGWEILLISVSPHFRYPAFAICRQHDIANTMRTYEFEILTLAAVSSLKVNLLSRKLVDIWWHILFVLLCNSSMSSFVPNFSIWVSNLMMLITRIMFYYPSFRFVLPIFHALWVIWFMVYAVVPFN